MLSAFNVDINMETISPKSSLDFNLLVLRILGTWSLPASQSAWLKLIYYIYSRFLVLGIVGSYCIGEVINIFVVWPNLEEVINTALIFVTHVGTAFKLRVFWSQRERIQAIIDTLDSVEFQPRTSGQSVMIRRTMTEIIIITKVFLLACVGTCLLWAIFPYLDENSADEKKLPLGVWVPYDFGHFPRYELTLIYQTCIIMGIGFCNISMDTFIAGVMAHGCVQLEVLGDSLTHIRERVWKVVKKEDVMENSTKCYDFNLVSHDDVILPDDYQNFNRKLQEYFVNCIQHHRKILSYTKELENLFNLGIFVQISASVVIICVTAFQISLVSPFSLQFQSMILYLSCILTEIFLFCWYGNGLILNSTSIPMALYTSNWYAQEFSKNFKKSMVFFMMRTARPITFRPGNFFTLSLDMFVAILRSSYTYFALLQRVHSDDP